MKDILMLTFWNFWYEDTGAHRRVFALANYLGKFTNLTVLLPRRKAYKDREILQQNRINFNVVFWDSVDEPTNIMAYLGVLEDYFRKHSPYACIIESLELEFLTQFIPDSVKLLLDPHDLLSSKQRSYELFGQKHPPITFEKEMALFKKFDKVLLIQEEEYNRVQAHLQDDKAMLVPHPAEFDKIQLREKAASIGFVASDYLPNAEGLRWFLKHVWPRVNKEHLTLNVFGAVKGSFAGQSFEKVVFHGFVEDLITLFDQIDIMINPVQFGAGLKIKNIESMGMGLPLISSVHSARGLMKGEGQAFLMAETPEEFADYIDLLAASFEKRTELGDNAYAFIQNNFSEQRCFDALLDFVCDGKVLDVIEI